MFALLPADHRLASRRSIRLDEITSEPFINFPKACSPELRHVIDEYFAHWGVLLASAHEAETTPMVISLVLSTGGVSLLPAYVQRPPPPSVVSWKPCGRPPTIALAGGYNASNISPILRRVLSKAFVLIPAATTNDP